MEAGCRFASIYTIRWITGLAHDRFVELEGRTGIDTRLTRTEARSPAFEARLGIDLRAFASAVEATASALRRGLWPEAGPSASTFIVRLWRSAGTFEAAALASRCSLRCGLRRESAETTVILLPSK